MRLRFNEAKSHQLRRLAILFFRISRHDLFWYVPVTTLSLTFFASSLLAIPADICFFYAFFGWYCVGPHIDMCNSTEFIKKFLKPQGFAQHSQIGSKDLYNEGECETHLQPNLRQFWCGVTCGFFRGGSPSNPSRPVLQSIFGLQANPWDEDQKLAFFGILIDLDGKNVLMNPPN